MKNLKVSMKIVMNIEINFGRGVSFEKKKQKI